jgi:hypothetical protein
MRDVEFGSPSDEPGFTSLWARLYAPDAAVLKQRVEEMAKGVCDDDPRTLGERRTDALTAMAAAIHELACECGNADCPAAQRDATSPSNAVVHVVAHADTVEAARAEPAAPVPAPAAEPDVDDAPAAEPASVAPASVAPAPHAAFCPAPPAFVIGGGVLPTPLLAATLERATVREVHHPWPSAARAALHPVTITGRFCAVPRPDVPLSLAATNQPMSAI